MNDQFRQGWNAPTTMACHERSLKEMNQANRHLTMQTPVRYGASLSSFLWVTLAVCAVPASDWPTYQHDVRRTGFTEERIAPSELALQWTWRSPHPPQPAWAGPAKWDAYAKRRDLPSMRSYDLAFCPIAAGNSVFFGTSTDDSVYCIDANSGRERWSYFTDGPVRVAPSMANGKLYFGSDDGYAYCLRSNDGALVWRFRPEETSRRILNDGRLISPYPCRTGVLVDGGIAYLGQPRDVRPSLTADPLHEWVEAASIKAEITDDGQGVWACIVRDPLPGAADWSHLYGRTDNSAFAGEQLGGAKAADDLQAQWIGRPGPRFQADRNGRKPSPLSTGGRLFVQGLHRIAALDAYNGTVLWSLEIPDLERFNMPRDCSNWCADRRFVYAAVRDKCWQIDATNGRVVRLHDVDPKGAQGWQYDWGYLASVGHRIIGSAVKEGTSWTNFWGAADAGWYDARSGAVTDKICSDQLFALEKETGAVVWTRAGGLVLNSTVTVAKNRVFLVECRHPSIIEGERRRVGGEDLWQKQYLVALDAETGMLLWESPIDTEDGTVVFYMAHSKNRLVIVSSTGGKYHVSAFSDKDGQPAWNQSFDWPGGKGDHGKAMSRPAIVGDRVFVRPMVFALADGAPQSQRMPGGGCGTYACSTDAVFFRSGTVTMWSPKAGGSSTWKRLRPDCWLSTIPAAGMLLSPEGGGGCSCGTWLEASVGFMPTKASKRDDS